MRLLLGLAAAAALAFSPAALAETVDGYNSNAVEMLKGAKHGLAPAIGHYGDDQKRARLVMFDNSAPTANYDFFLEFTYVWGWTGYLDVLANDTDPDLPNDTLTVTGVSGSSYASVSGNSIYFSGPPGIYSLHYTIEDSHGLTSGADVDLYVSFCSDHECS